MRRFALLLFCAALLLRDAGKEESACPGAASCAWCAESGASPVAVGSSGHDRTRRRQLVRQALRWQASRRREIYDMETLVAAHRSCRSRPWCGCAI